MILIVYLMRKQNSLEKTLKHSAWNTALPRITALLVSSTGGSVSVVTLHHHSQLLLQRRSVTWLAQGIRTKCVEGVGE